MTGDKAVLRRRGLWLVPLALLFHNLEEALAIPAALPRLQAAWSEGSGRTLPLPSAAQYQRALVLLTIAGFALLLLARVRDRWSYALVVVQAVMTLNVLTHLAGALLVGGYVPGVATAVLVEAPTSAFVYRHVREGGWMSRSQWRLLVPLAVVLHGAGLIGLLLWARRG